MMHPTISEALAKSGQQQFRREAEQWRLARLARSRAGGVPARAGRPAAAVTGMAAGLASRALRVTASWCRPRSGCTALCPATMPGWSARRLPDAHEPVDTAPAPGRGTRQSRPGYRGVVVPARAMTMCQHQPPCPPAGAPDRAAARTVASHPEQGWSLLCNRVVLFDDGGELLPGGRAVEPPRPLGETGIQPSRRRPIPAELQILAAIPA